MEKIKWRVLLMAVVLVAAFTYLAPTVFTKLPSWWGGFLPDRAISLGLDLKGGIHLVMEVDLNAALESATGRNADELRQALSKDNIVATKVEASGLKIQADFPDQAAMDSAEKLLKSDFRNLEVSSKGGRGDFSLDLALTPAETANIKSMTAGQALETIRNRVDAFGVTEPDIRPQGEDRIVIQLPGLDDPERAEALIGKTAILEFKLVDDARDAASVLKSGVTPAGFQILYGKEKDVDGRQRPYLLKKQALMTGAGLTDARVTADEFGRPEVAITFDSRGSRQFERVTGEYVRRQMAIVLDNVVYSAPVIQTRIAGGRAVINGMGSPEEARDLAVVLRAGALPAPVKVLERRAVGPSLGADSIAQGLNAGLLGIGLVLAFMLFYYRWSGLIAVIALITNVPLIMGALAGFGATLTLPGIFGLVLTLGMAVDANVLIFERIREELREGKSPKAAIAGGFGRAFWTIFDSNLTTLITALVLFQFGTGPIRGFAVTLSVGILSSMFTAIFFSRLIFDLALGGRKVERLSI